MILIGLYIFLYNLISFNFNERICLINKMESDRVKYLVCILKVYVSIFMYGVLFVYKFFCFKCNDF